MTARELETAAAEIRSRRRTALSVAAHDAAENPLYDRRLPAEELGSILQRIRAGMQPARGPIALAS